MAENVKVAVRIRPFSERETESNAKCVLDVADNQVCVTKPFVFYKQGIRDKILEKIEVAKTFSFDHIFWSLDDKDRRYSDQHDVYAKLGPSVITDTFAGFNCCIFAYGQTGSGKTYTMLGRNTPTKEGEGIIPRLCNDIFERVKSDSTSIKVVVSYMEIYNEKVHDLLDPKGKQNLKVREHPTLGPYVDGLKQLAVSSFEDIEQLLISGNRQRTVAATSMNIESSRSHAIFTLKITQMSVDAATGITGEKVSKVSLVDLAGSERVSKSGAVGERLREGSNINKSLTTLGLVIAALADQNSGVSSSCAANSNKQQKQLQTTGEISLSSAITGGAGTHIPYRDSVLTWLLRDCLGGNTRTVLVATVSPAEDSLGETISTLRYADRAKRIVNRAVVNEDPTAKIIRELREEVEQLRGQLSTRSRPNTPMASSGFATTNNNNNNNGSQLVPSMTRSSSSVSGSGSSTDLSLIDRLDASERLMTEMSRTWEDRLLESDRLKTERNQEFERLGIRVESGGIRLAKNRPTCFLVNLNADPSLNEMLVYYLNQPGTTLVCKMNESNSEMDDPLETEAKIRLNGVGIQNEHAEISVDQNGVVRLKPALNAYTLVNDNLLTREIELKHGDNLQFGTSDGTLFRLNCANSKQLKQTVVKEKEKEDMADVTVAAIEKHYELIAFKNGGISPGTISPSTSQESLVENNGNNNNSSPISISNSNSNLNSNSTSVGVSAVTGRVSKHQQQMMIQSRLDEDRKRRQERLQGDLKNLRRQLIRTNTMVYEANLMASQYKVPVLFAPTLQIPPSMLEVGPHGFKTGSDNRPSLLSEPAVLATSQRGTGYQRTLALAEFESVLTACRDSLADGFDSANTTATPGWQLASVIDESSPTGGLQLVGVANIYLSALFYTIPFTYSAPIISTLGETCGHLTVTITRRPDHLTDFNNVSSLESFIDSNDSSTLSSNSTQNEYNTLSYYSQSKGLRIGDFAIIRIAIASVSGLDVRTVAMCRYTFWDSPLASSVQPVFFRSMEDTNANVTRFDDVKTYRVRVTDEFIDYCAEAALPIQIWQYPSLPEHENPDVIESSVPSCLPTAEDHRNAIFKALLERWREVIGRLEFSVEILESKDDGTGYVPVQVDIGSDENRHSGGIYRLTHGRSRRVFVQVQTIPGSNLPLQIDSIMAVQFGGVLVRQADSGAPLDSYQSTDLDILLNRWGDALSARTKYLDEQLRQIGNSRASSLSPPGEASPSNQPRNVDVRREATIFQEWSLLVAEKELSEEPQPGCGLPGAELADDEFSDQDILRGREMHRPVIFLDLPVESLTTGYPVARQNLAGANCFLEKEMHGKFIQLPVLKEVDGPIGAVAGWDPIPVSWLVFDRPTMLDDKIYAIVRLVVRLSHPTQIDVMLRKRLCFTVNQAPPPTSSPSKLLSRLTMLGRDNANKINQNNNKKFRPQCTQTSVTYDVISNLPLASYDVARRSVLAKMAADPSGTAVNTTAIEQYVKAVQAVESLMVMDRLRQQLALQRCIDNALGRSGVSQESAAPPPSSRQITPSPQPSAKSPAPADLSSTKRSRGEPSLKIATPPPMTVIGQNQVPPVVMTMNSLSAASLGNNIGAGQTSHIYASAAVENAQNGQNLVSEIDQAFPTF